MVLGQSSKRFSLDHIVVNGDGPVQGGLFGTVMPSPPSSTNVAEHERKSRKGVHPGRNPIADHLPRRIEVLLPDGLEGEDLEDGSYHVPGYKIIGTEVSERIEFIPGCTTVIETRRPKLVALQASTSVQPTPTIKMAALPQRLLSKCIADETLAVELIIRKFCEHMPLYRQAQSFKRDYNWIVSRSTLGIWVDRVAVALRPLHDELRRQIFSGAYIHTDGWDGAAGFGSTWFQRRRWQIKTAEA